MKIRRRDFWTNYAGPRWRKACGQVDGFVTKAWNREQRAQRNIKREKVIDREVRESHGG